MIDLLGTLSAISILPPAIAFLFFRQSSPDETKGLRAFVFGSVVFELIFLLTSFRHMQNVQWSHVYAVFELTTLSIFFYGIFGRSLFGTLLIAITSVGLVYLVVNPLLFEPWNSFNPLARSVNSLLIAFFCLLFYFKIFKEEEIQHLERVPRFWFVSGLLIYFTTSFFTFLLSSQIFELAPDKISNSWFFHSVSNITKNLLITLGLWTGRR